MYIPDKSHDSYKTQGYTFNSRLIYIHVRIDEGITVLQFYPFNENFKITPCIENVKKILGIQLYQIIDLLLSLHFKQTKSRMC